MRRRFGNVRTASKTATVSRMRITFLGTSSGAPSRTRNVTSIALQLPERGVVYLFDCGEGTQHQMLRSPLKPGQLERIFITHLHGDHLFGLIGLLASRSLATGGVTLVTLYGPEGLEEYVRCSVRVSRTHLAYPLEVRTVAPGTVFEDDTLRVICAPMQHGIESYGYAVIEKEQTGRLDVAKAQALGIPAGPLYGRLKNGETVTLPDGRTINGQELVGPPRPGRKIVFTGDTTYTPAAVELARNADLLIHEATYSAEDLPLAERARHATTTMAARVASEADVHTLILTHISPRYESDEGRTPDDLLREARAIFPNTLLAHDFFTYEVPRRAEETWEAT